MLFRVWVTRYEENKYFMALFKKKKKSVGLELNLKFEL